MQYYIAAYKKGHKVFSKVETKDTDSILAQERKNSTKEVIDNWNRLGSSPNKLDLIWKYTLIS